MTQVDLSGYTDRIQVDMTTRKIADSGSAGTQYDHKAVMKVFEVDRYLNGVDLSEKLASIHWACGKNGGVYPVTEWDAQSVEGKILIKWELLQEYTQGTVLTYSIHFYDLEGEGYGYHASTRIARDVLPPTLVMTDHSNKTGDPSAVEQLEKKLDDVEKSIVRPDQQGNVYYTGDVYVKADENSANGKKVATEDSVDSKLSESQTVILEAIDALCPCVVEISEGDNGITSTKTFEEINEVINSAARGEIYAEMLVRDGSATYHTLKLPLVEHYTTAIIFSAINSGYFEKKYYKEVNKLYQEYIETPARFFITITNEDEITITKIPMADRWKITVTESESDSSIASPDMTARTFQTIMQNAPNMRPYCVYKGDTYEYFSGVFKYFCEKNNSIMLKQLAFRTGSNYIDRKVMSYSEIAVSTVDPCVTLYNLGYPGVLYGPGLSEITANPSKYVLAKFQGKFDGAYLTLSELTSTCAMYKRYYTDANGVLKYDFIKIVAASGSSENTYGTEVVDLGIAQADWDEQNNAAPGYIQNKPHMIYQDAIIEDNDGNLSVCGVQASTISINDAMYILDSYMPYMTMGNMMVLGIDRDGDNVYLTYPKKAEDGTVSIVTTAYPASKFGSSSTGTNTSA